ncbi:15837_t:CDS:2, partial [Rhizophagus irregularis]
MNQNENLTLILDIEERIQELKMLPHHEKLFYLFYRFCKVSNSGIGYRRALVGYLEIGD